MNKGKLSLGVLGLGSRSTLFYIEELNNQYNSYSGGYSTCPFVLMNVDFNDVNPYLPNRFPELKMQLLKYIPDLDRLQIDLLLIPNITLHEAWEQLNSEVSIVHPVHSTLDVLKKKQINEVIIFGSLYGMESRYLQTALASNQIKTVQPTQEEKLFLDGLRKLIYIKKETVQDIDKYRALLRSYSKNKAVLISCTELSIPLVGNELNVYDMARIQIHVALDRSFFTK